MVTTSTSMTSIQVQMRSMATILGGLMLSSVALAEEPTAAESSEGSSVAEAESAPDEDARAGYIPGYKRAPNLSLTPYSPQTAAIVGNTAIPFWAPSSDGEWQFKFSGYASASLRLSTNERSDPGPGQSS